MSSIKRLSAIAEVVHELKNQFGEQKIKTAEILARYVTFKIGGPADIFFIARSQQELISAVTVAKNHEVPVTILGGGTNVVIADRGIRGMVIKNETHGIRVVGLSGSVKKTESLIDSVVIESDSGVLVNQLVRYTIDECLTGLEPFLGQPGTVGGAMYINAHNMRRGVFFGDHVVEASILGESGDFHVVPVSYFRFGYDESRLQDTGETVVSVKFRLKRGDKEQLWQVASASMTYRRETQPLGMASAGCTFRNIKKTDAIRLHTPNHTVSAGYLLDSVGLKGYQIGGAKFSDRHANFIVNTAQATAADILALMVEAKRRVKREFGIELREEVVLLGEF